MGTNNLFLNRDLGRNNFLDTLRGIAILGVVCIHFGGSFVVQENAWTPSFYVGLSLNQFFSFSVPLFVFISGLLASPYISDRKQSFYQYYRGRIKKIVYPYLIASVFAFFLLGINIQFEAISSGSEKISWLFSHFFYYGIHPTFYFVPMIFLLYVIKPFLIWMAPTITLNLNKISSNIVTLSFVLKFLLFILFIIYLVFGYLCYTGKLDYYTWCRPNPLFWACFFYFGLIFPQLSKCVSIKKINSRMTVIFLLILLGYFFDWRELTNISEVGSNFESSKIDYAYSRPIFLVLNALIILFVASLLLKGFNRHNQVLSFTGKYTLEIYLWHLIFLYFIAWRYESVLNAVKHAPELILSFALLTTISISTLFFLLRYIKSLYDQYTVKIIVEKRSS